PRSRHRSPPVVSALPRRPHARRVCFSQAISTRACPAPSPAGASRQGAVLKPPSTQMRPAHRLGSSRLSAAEARLRGGALSWSSVMSRFVSIFLPHLPIERLQRESDAPLEDDRPLALVGNAERGLILTAVNAASLGQDLFPGLGLA